MYVQCIQLVLFPVRCTLSACLPCPQTVRQNNSEHKDETASNCTQPVPLSSCDTQTTLCAHCSKTLPAPFRPTTGRKGKKKETTALHHPYQVHLARTSDIVPAHRYRHRQPLIGVRRRRSRVQDEKHEKNIDEMRDNH